MAKTSNAQTDYDLDNDGASLSDRFAGLGDSAAQGIDHSPLIALGAGLALGAVLGAVLPASRKEKELLQPLGARINEAGAGAIDRGRGMAKQKFDEMAGDKLRDFLGAATSATTSTSNA